MKNFKLNKDTKVQFIILLVLVVCAYFFHTPTVSLGAGVKVDSPPIQTELTTPAKSFKSGNYTITPMMEFDCKAKVIGRKVYSDDWSDICPIDYTLGWQLLSDEANLRHITFSQRTRWTYYKYSDLPKPLSHTAVTSQHANMHMCPSSDTIRKQLLNTPVGSIIHFKGKLISIKRDGGKWSATSSVSRTDKRGGACEIIWVESFTITNN